MNILNSLHRRGALFPRTGYSLQTGGLRSRLPRKKRQFTLIELLIVIAIIAIVVASKTGFFLQFSAIFAFKTL